MAQNLIDITGNTYVLGLNDIGAIKEKLEDVERYCAEIISLGL